MNSENTWIVVPAFNEAEVIRQVIMPLTTKYYQVVVVDDASTDQTLQELKKLPVDICHHSVNLGQGAALQTGISYALAKGAKYLVTFDADGQHDVNDIPKLLAPLYSGDFDVVLGTRFGVSGEAAGIPMARRRMLILAVIYTRLTVGLRVTDTHNGYRAFTAEAAEKLDITLNKMAHASQILNQISQHSMRYTEVPVTVKYTTYTLAKGQKTGDFVNIIWDSMMGLFRK